MSGISPGRSVPREPRRKRTPEPLPILATGTAGASAGDAGFDGSARRTQLDRRLLREPESARAEAADAVGLGRDLVVVLAHLAHIGDLGVVGLAQQPREAAGVEQRVLPAVHRHHAQPQRLLPHRGAELGQVPGS